MSSASHSESGRRLPAFSIVLLMLMVSFTHIQFSNLAEKKWSSLHRLKCGTISNSLGDNMVGAPLAMEPCQCTILQLDQ